MSGWIHSEGNGVILTLHIQPGAKKTEVAGLHGDALKIRLHAPPVDGKANAALVEFLSARLKVSRRQITLQSGQTARRKQLKVEDLSLADVENLLLHQA